MGIQSTYNLDNTDYKIFLKLQNDPRSSTTSIAKLLDVTSETVRTRLHKLKSKEFLRPDKEIKDPVFGKRSQSEVEAKYRPESLGLYRYHVFFIGVDTEHKASTLEELFNNHPYTHYWSRCYGEGGCYYAQFDIPNEINDLLIKFLNKIQETDICTRYLQFSTDYFAGSKVNLQDWDISKRQWNIDVKGYSFGTNLIENLWNYFLENKPKNIDNKYLLPSNVSFDYLDLKLLRELTINSKLSLTEISKFYDKDISTLSKRIKTIRKTIATDDVLYYDRKVFDITYSQIIVGHFMSDGVTADELLGFVNSGFLPFTSDLTISGNSFLWYQSVPSYFAPGFSEFIWKFFHLDQVFQLQLEKTLRYYFYHKNYDSSTGWITDKTYNYDNVIELLN